MSDLDGKVVFGTEIDSSGMNKGYQEIISKIESLESKVKSLSEKTSKSFSSDFQKSLSEAGKKYTNMGLALTNIGSGMQTVGKAITAATAPITAFGTYGVKSAVDFEDALVGVKKTTDMTGEEMEKFKKNILDLTEEIPRSGVELNNIGEIAGQLGIRGVDNLTKFTKTIAMLSDSTNLETEEAAKNLARFINITGSSQDSIEKLGSCIVALGNNFATSEQEIVDMAMRIAGAGKQCNMTDADIMALSTSMSSLGIASEMGKLNCPAA